MRSRPAFPSIATGLQWLVLAVLGAALLLPQLLVQLASIPHFCLFERVTGLACPGCGVTGALLQLARGNATVAWQSHPGAVLLPFYLLSTLLLNHLKLSGSQRHAVIWILDYGFLACLTVFWTVSTLIPRLT
jgi:hypothetical protein